MRVLVLFSLTSAALQDGRLLSRLIGEFQIGTEHSVINAGKAWLSKWDMAATTCICWDPLRETLGREAGRVVFSCAEFGWPFAMPRATCRVGLGLE